MLKVASYNMRKGIGLDRLRRPERTLAVLKEIDADIVALQEADRRFGARVAALPVPMIEHGSPWRHVPLGVRPDSLGWHGNAILVKKDLELLRHARIALPTLEPRGAVLAEVETHAGPIRVVGMHLDLSGLWRVRQAAAIMAQLDELPPMPTILMGDLNEWRPQGGCLAQFGQHFHIAHTGPSYHASRPLGRLDRIMASGLKVVSAGVHHSASARRASDHLPIWATLTPPAKLAA